MKKALLYFVSLLALGGIISYLGLDIPAHSSSAAQTNGLAQSSAAQEQASEPASQQFPPRLPYHTSTMGAQGGRAMIRGQTYFQRGPVGEAHMMIVSSDGANLVDVYPIPGKTIKLGMNIQLPQTLIDCPGYDVTLSIGRNPPLKMIPFSPCHDGMVQLALDLDEAEKFGQIVHRMDAGPYIFEQGNNSVAVMGAGNQMGPIQFAESLHPWGMQGDNSSPP